MGCDVCGQPAREEELIEVDDRWICTACKPVFLQRLHEGRLPPLPFPLPDGFDERVLGIFELLTIAGKVFRQDWLAIGGITLITTVATAVVRLAMQVSGEISRSERLLHAAAIVLADICISVLVLLGVAKIAEERLEGRKIGLGAAMLHAGRRWLPVIWTYAFFIVIVGFLTLALVVPGIIWMGYYTFFWCVVSLRSRSGKKALDYSKFLVVGRWWHVMWITLVFVVCTYPVSYVIQLIEKYVTIPASVLPTIEFGPGLLGSFFSVATTVLFLNLDAMRRRISNSAPPAEVP